MNSNGVILGGGALRARWPMTFFLIGLILLFGRAFLSAEALEKAQFPPAGFQLALADEFSSARLNRDLWSTSLEVFGRWGDRYHNDSYLNYLSDDDVLIGGGSLQLRSDYRSVEGDNPPGVYDYSSGMVSSKGHYTFTYGYIEIRARFPGGKGVWPAFWLMPEKHQWPPEFDIAEYYAGRGLMHLGLCHGDFPEINWDSGGNSDVDFEGGWNTYGLLWSPGKAQWVQNGVVKREALGPHVPSIPMYVILSNGVSSRIGPSGEPDQSTVFPNFFEIDYLRVWQKSPALLPPLSTQGEVRADQKTGAANGSR